MKKPALTKEQVMYWLELFKDGDIDDENYREKLINTLLHSVYVYDDDGDDGDKKIVLNFNTSNNNQIEVGVFDHRHVRSTNEPKVEHLIYMTRYEIFTFVAHIEKA
jgi:hypothetical protein